ncbi:MAG: hypothetical protein K9M99_06035 [Candidatus Cloacimonetes bacterium]|nr:hypothetical protein [Candidatus Cloacimonadota bacterium]
MKRAFFLMLLIIILAGCESPLKVGVIEMNDVSPVLFRHELYTSGDDFSAGYNSGRLRSDRILIEWEPYTDNDFMYYSLKRNNAQEIIITDISETSVLDSINVNDDTKYEYTLVVMAENGMYGKDIIKVKTPRWDPPGNLSVNGLNHTDLILNWGDRSDTEEHFIVYLYSEEMVKIDSFFTEPDVEEKVVSDLVFMEYYHFKVKAIGAWEEDINSMTMGFRAGNFVLADPRFLEANQNPDNTVTVTWEDQSNYETGFSLERKLNANDFIEIADLDYSSGSNFIEYIDTDSHLFDNDDIVTYRVRVYNDYEDETVYSDYSDETELLIIDMSDVVCIELQVDEWNQEASWNLYMQSTGDYYYDDWQDFTEEYQIVTRDIILEAGLYSIHCWDDFGDGGISGSVIFKGEILVEWDKNDYSSREQFNFEIPAFTEE